MDQELTSHALGGLAGSRRGGLDMRSWPPSWTMTSYQNRTPSSIDAHLPHEQSCQISSRSDLKRRSRRLFWRALPQQEQEHRYGISSWTKKYYAVRWI